MRRTLLAGAALLLVPLVLPAPGSATASPVGTETAGPATRAAQPGIPLRSGPRRSDEPDTGLQVTMERITPAALEPGEPITVSGRITNLDRETWGDVQVYLRAPGAPATTNGQLGDVAASPPSQVDGTLITSPDRLYEELGPIEAGANEGFELEIPFNQLGIPRDQYGVYTLTVEVWGNDPFGFRSLAGRARSFIPLMPDSSPSVGVATIWPFRADLVRRPDGTYENTDDLIEEVESGGRLRTLLDLARTSGEDTPISLLVDPALLDALQRIANDNTGPPEPPTETTESPSATDDTGFEAVPFTAGQQAARAFLDDLIALASEHSVWAEGYGGPDLTTLSGDYDSSRLFRTITRATSGTLSELELQDSSRAYLPSGPLDVEALDALGPLTTTFVTSDQVRKWKPTDGPVGVVRSHGSRARVVVTHTDLVDGAPAPGPTDTALQVRQRLLAESALLSLRADTTDRRSTPSIAVLPDDDWDPGDDANEADFFEAFNAPWVRSTNLDTELNDGPRKGAKRLKVSHRGEQRADPPIPDSLARSADRIRGRGVIMFAITRDDRQVLSYYDQAAALTVSDQWRAEPDVSQELADESVADLDRQIDAVTIEAPEFVTLSSSSGRFPLTINNDLAWPITVGVELKAEDGGLTISQDEVIQVDPHQSTTVNVPVDAEDVGVTEVTARLTTPEGRPFGEPVTFKMRSSVVGTVIWIALGAAGAIVFLAIGRRIWRSSRANPEPSKPGWSG